MIAKNLPKSVKDCYEIIKRLEKENEVLHWTPIYSPEQLPDDDKVYWVTYEKFYGNYLLGKGKREKHGNHEMWRVSSSIAVSINRIRAIMPYFEPEPYQ